MAAQDVRALIPRVRRAIEGPVPLTSGALSDGQVEALAADCIADIILFTEGGWDHTLSVSEMDETGDYPIPLHYEVDPELSLPEQALIAAQAALSYFIHSFKDMKTSEVIRNEARTWEWQKSPNLLRDWLQELINARDKALDAVMAENAMIMARYASILAAREPLIAALIEPWAAESGRGGQPVLP
jgi:hypothetical protein